jgi:hypothetical protein
MNTIIENEKDYFTAVSTAGNLVVPTMPKTIEFGALTTHGGNVRLFIEEGNMQLAATMNRETALALAAWIQENV